MHTILGLEYALLNSDIMALYNILYSIMQLAVFCQIQTI